jgi:acetyl esterase
LCAFGLVALNAHAQTPDPQMGAVLQTLQSIEGTPFYNLSPQDARQQFSTQDAAKGIARTTGKQLAPDPVGSIMDQMTIPGPGGGIPIRIFSPAGTGPFPVIVYFHGGGFVIATIDTYDASARALANMVGAVVISVEYRKAPEHPFPAALDDAVASYKWAVRNTGLINAIPGKIAVAGESAGGNLATEVCLTMRDQAGPMPVYQLLVYPITNNNMTTASYMQFANAQPLNLPALQWFAKYTYQNPADQTNPYAFPLKASLGGLPPATIIAAQIDPLQTEGQQYATALQAADVVVDYRLYTGVTHEFFGLGAVVDTAKQAEMDAAADLKAAFAK